MKNLSNIKATLAVSMLLSASLFSMETSCGCKLAGEMLQEKEVSASQVFVGGTASLAPEYQTNEISKSRTYLDGREKGIIVIGGRSIIIETGKEGIVVQGGLHRAVYENETAARIWAEVQARDDHFNSVIAQYDLVRLRENFSGDLCLNAVVDAHIRAAVLVSSDSDVKGLLATSDSKELDRLIGVRYVEGQKALRNAQKEEAKELTKLIASQKSKLSHFVANTSENEEFNKFAGVSYAAIGKPKETDCGGFKVEYMRNGPSHPQYKKLFKAIKSSDDQNAVAYLDHVTRIEALEAQSAELVIRMSQTKDRIDAAEISNGELKTVAEAAKKSFVESLRTTTDDRLYALKSIMNNAERVSNDGARKHQLSDDQLAQRRNATSAMLQFHVRDVKHVGVEDAVEKRLAASTREFRQETFEKNDTLTGYMRYSDDRNLRQAFFANDLARLQAKGKGAVRELDYRIHELQSDLETHEASDRLVHAAMGKKAPAPKCWFASAVCYLTK
ncbi:MAG: hypothetical protein NT128_07200 [Proteobacteria bacterium]|nr:hypothetical protein [Pseudomonadota bacterium]